MKHKKRIIAIILSLIMLFSNIPAYAANDEDTLKKTKFDGAVPNDKAVEIHFCKKTDKPAEATKDKGDISVADAGGKIHVYADNAETKYWVVHEDNGKIIFPENSSYLFSGCINLTTVTFEEIDTGKVTSMYSMFLNCGKLTSLDLRSFNTEKVTDMALMFNGCSTLTNLNVGGFDTGQVDNMAYMFSGCKNLTSLDLSQFNTGEVTNMERMFSGCSGLKAIFASGQFITTKVTSGDNMFKGCTPLKGGKGTVYDESHVDYTYARLDNPPSVPGYFRDKTVTHTVSFDPNGGSGSMDDFVTHGRDYTLPACTFIPPAGQIFDQWEVGGTKYNVGDTISNITAALSVKAHWKTKPTPPPAPPTPSVPSAPATPTESLEDEFITLKTSLKSKSYTAEGIRSAFNGAIKFEITIDEQGKIHVNFLDKEGNKVKTKGAVKLTMPVKEGMTPPYRIKVNGKYTTFAEENGQISFVIRPTAQVEMICLTDAIEGQNISIEGTPHALNGAKEIKAERKENGKLNIRLYNEKGEEIKSKGYVFIQIPIPKNTKAPYRVKVDGKQTTFEEMDKGSVIFASLL